MSWRSHATSYWRRTVSRGQPGCRAAHATSAARDGGCAPPTHAFVSVKVTVSTTGPTNRPMMPKAINPPMTPAKMRSSGRLAPRLIRIRPDDVVDRAREDGDDEQRDGDTRLARPVEPSDGRQEHQQRPELRKAEEQHHGGKQPCGGNPGHVEGDAADRDLNQRRHNHPEYDGANSAPGEEPRPARLALPPGAVRTGRGRRAPIRPSPAGWP